MDDVDDYFAEEYEEDNAEVCVSLVNLFVLLCNEVDSILNITLPLFSEGRRWRWRRWNFPCWDLVGRRSTENGRRGFPILRW